MAGTVEGGKKAAKKNLESDPDFYAKIGSKGGSRGTTGGFASDKVGADGLTGRERALVAGAKGGATSRKRPKGSKITTEEDREFEATL